MAVGVLNRKSKEQYLLQAQVSHRAEEKAELRGCIDLTIKPEQPDLFVLFSLSVSFLCHAHSLLSLSQRMLMSMFICAHIL